MPLLAMLLTFLGTGTSVGVPMIGCDCAVCRSDDPRDARLRTGLLIEAPGGRIVVDLSADFRQQALRERIDRIDAILITHCHADHVFGLDDIRPFNFKHGALPLYASERTWRDLRHVFSYIFERAHVGGGLPQIIPQTITGEFAACGLHITPIPVVHGRLEVTSFRFSDGARSCAFVTDCNEIPPASLAQLRDLDLLILDTLRVNPHPTHLHLEQALAYIAELAPRRALLTHLGHDFPYAQLRDQLPPGVEPAFDGMKIDL